MSVKNKSGIAVTSGFKLVSEAPLDLRTVVETSTELQDLLEEGAAYEGLRVYVKDTQLEYIFVADAEGTLGYKVATAEAVVDDAFYIDSTNPVQSTVIQAALDKKQNTLVAGVGITLTDSEEDTTLISVVADSELSTEKTTPVQNKVIATKITELEESIATKQSQLTIDSIVSDSSNPVSGSAVAQAIADAQIEVTVNPDATENDSVLSGLRIDGVNYMIQSIDYATDSDLEEIVPPVVEEEETTTVSE